MSFSETFDRKISELCLSCFPSGIGEWRHDATLVESLTPRQLKNMKNIESQFSITLKDHDASKEKADALKEFVSQKKSPWLMDYEWSTEAQSLRELSIEAPWKVTKERVNSHFKCIRLANENIYHLDKFLAHLVNLESIVLSANMIQEVPSSSLPRKLKSLELYSNLLEGIDSLVEPLSPPLGMEHLGFGANHLTTLYAQISGVYWPSLISLDLSKNHLNDIGGLVTQLATLPKLRYLLLMGNPIALLPYYRGYVIDALKKLIILDDIRISADERHGFRGMLKRIGHFNERIHITFKVSRLINVPIPDELKNPGEVPEFPVINRKYFLCFWVVEELQKESEPSSNGENVAPQATTAKHGNNNNNQNHQTILINPLPTVMQTQEEDGAMREALCTSSVPYAPGEALSLEWTHTILSNQLRTWRDYLLNGIHFDLVEEKSLLYPPDELPVEPSSTTPCPSAGKGGKKAGGPKRKTSIDGSAGNEVDKKKKKKIDESQLVEYSREWRILGHFRENAVHQFVNSNEKLCKTTVHADLIKSQKIPSSATNKSVSGMKGKPKEVAVKDKKPAAPAVAPAATNKTKPVPGPAPPKKGTNQEEKELPEDSSIENSALGADVEFQVLQWKNTRESFSPDELRGAAGRVV